MPTNKQIVAALSNLSEQGYEILSCDFLTGQIAFRFGPEPLVSPRETLMTGIREKAIQALREGRKIEAIKIHFQGLSGEPRRPSLAESKAWVESLGMAEGLGHFENGYFRLTSAPVSPLVAPVALDPEMLATSRVYRYENDVCDCGDPECGRG